MGSSPLLSNGALVLLGLFAVGLYLFRSAVRRSGDRPHCRRCHYDVSQQLARGGCCPECGQVLDQPDATVAGERVLRVGRRWAGLALMLAVLAVPLVVLTSSRASVYPYLPSSVLRFLVRHGNTSDLQAAYGHLVKRHQTGSFSRSELIDVELDVHRRNLNDEKIGLWALPNLAVLATALEDGSASSEQATRLAEQIADGLDLRLSPRLALGAATDVRFLLRAGAPAPLHAEVHVQRMQSDRESLVLDDQATGWRHLHRRMRIPFRYTRVGVHQVTLQVRVEVVGSAGPLVSSRAVTFERWVNVAPLQRSPGGDMLVTNGHRLMTTEVRGDTLRIAFDTDMIGSLWTTVAFDLYVDWGDGPEPTGARLVSRCGQVSACCDIELRAVDRVGEISLLLVPSRAALGDAITPQEVWTGALLFDRIDLSQTDGAVRQGLVPPVLWQEEAHLGLLPELLDAAQVRELLAETQADLTLVQ